MLSTGESTPSRSNFAMSSPPGSSTVASSPPLLDEDVDDQLPTSKAVPSVSKIPDPIEEQDLEARFTRLNYLLQRSSLYANLLQDQMDRSREKHAAAAIIAETPTPAKRGRGRPKAKPAPKKTKGKRARVDSDDEADGDLIPNSKRAKVEVASGENGQQDVPEKPAFVQPALLTGATLKDYQLDGVAWMVGLWENGISGILADEMGLGKTIQTIAFIAYLRTRVDSPFLVVCPLSVMHNWIDEFQKFAPDIPVCMYHGSPEERKEMRNTDMSLDKLDDAYKVTNTPKRKAASKTQPKKGRPAKTKAKPKGNARNTRRKSTVDSDDELAGFSEDDIEELEAKEVPPEEPVNSTHQKSMFPVVVTTYEIIIKDRQPMSKIKWGYIVVDEGHRLKNMDCKLMQEIKKYNSAGRMVLTGTPLHNNLAELWSLLNFILPDIFDDVDVFQKWFNLPELSIQLSTDRTSHILQTLHSILKPFLLRRVKADVERSLPPKKEYVLYAPLSERQREIYDAIVRHDIRRLLVGARPDVEDEHEQCEAEEKEKQEDDAAEDEKPDRKLRKQERRNYDVDGSDDDDAYFEALERDGVQDNRQKEPEKSTEQLGKEYAYKTMLKKVNNLHLENVVMQLRKVCSHPFLFDWPLDSRTGQYVVDEQLEDVSGKMMVLERLLEELFKRGHKVLVFSQFTTMLDVIQDWATEFKRWSLCRIDGSSKPMERRREMVRFQTGGDAPDAPRLFLLSTRAGGLGINLTAADTVVFYDSDWNPQMDLQAADRAHRIGQTKPVLIFRLISKHTVEQKILERATQKRQLEAMIIAKGKFKMPAQAGKQETMAEVATSLLTLEGEKIEVVQNTAAGKASVISDAELDSLLDRRPEVFQGRGKGWTSAGLPKTKDTKKPAAGEDGAAFAVFETTQDEGNDALARMLGEDVVDSD